MKRAVVGLTLLAAPGLAWACVALGPSGPVAVRGEEALIVWDQATKTEHFIRQISFRDAPADFGFLVPSATKPELAEVKAPVFHRLFDLYQRPQRRSAAPAGSGPPTALVSAAPPPVEVIEHKTVAGLDATVLLASDPAALATWLSAHHYPSSPAIATWLAPYVHRHAYVTAFKLAGGAAASTSSVRMSFHTDSPTFPYSEPPGNAPARPFRLSVIAPTKMTGRLGSAAWSAPIGYARPFDRYDAAALLEGVVPTEAQKPGFLTVFDEPSSVRGADDLVLTPASDDKRVASTISLRIE